MHLVSGVHHAAPHRLAARSNAGDYALRQVSLVSADLVRFIVADGVAAIATDQPDTRNALTDEMQRRL